MHPAPVGSANPIQSRRHSTHIVHESVHVSLMLRCAHGRNNVRRPPLSDAFWWLCSDSNHPSLLAQLVRVEKIGCVCKQLALRVPHSLDGGAQTEDAHKLRSDLLRDLALVTKPRYKRSRHLRICILLLINPLTLSLRVR